MVRRPVACASATWEGVTGTYLSRANLADFMLKRLADDQYVGKAPIVTDA